MLQLISLIHKPGRIVAGKCFENAVEMVGTVKTHFVGYFADVQIGFEHEPLGFVNANLIDVGFKIATILFENGAGNTPLADIAGC